MAERKDLLCAFFWLLTLISYSYYTVRPDWRRYLLVFIGAGLALMAKPMAVTLPFLLLLLDYWPLQRYVRFGTLRLVLEKMPLLGLVLLAAILTFMAQRQAGAVSSAADLGLLPRLTNSIVAYGEYVKLLLWPQDLAVLYRYRIDHSIIRLLFSLLGLAGCSWWVFRERRRYPFLLVGWCWFIGTLVPVIGLVQVGGQAWADRYTYFPAIGFWLALVWFGYGVCPRSRRWLVGGVIVTVALCYLSLSWQQNRYWRNSVTLFQRAVAVDTENSVAYSHLGQAYAEEQRWGEAGKAFARALEIDPHFGLPIVKWGDALQEQNRDQEAEAMYLRALQPGIDGIEVYVALATLYKKQHRLEEAEKILRKGLTFAPGSAEINYNLGTIMIMRGNASNALPVLREALQERPSHVKTRINLGIALAQTGKLNEAEKQFNFVLLIDPEHAKARYNSEQISQLRKGQNK